MKKATTKTTTSKTRKTSKKQKETAEMMSTNENESMNMSANTDANTTENSNDENKETIEMANVNTNENENKVESTVEDMAFEIEDINLDGDDENSTEINTDANTTENSNDENKETIEMMNETVNEMMNETVVETKTVESTATTFMVGGYKVSGLTQEQLEAALKAAGIFTEIKPVKTTVKVVDKLQHDGNYAIDKTGDRFEFASLTEEQKTESMKSGLSPKNLAILAQAAQIKQISGYRTRQVNNSNQPTEEKPGYQIREIVKSNLEMIGNDENLLNNLQNKEFCKKNFKFAYPMFLDITGLDSVQIRSARKDNKGHDRYAPAIYEIGGKQYLLTNDLYAKNLPLVKTFFHVG